MKPETLRSARIVLLKATHGPYVALILGYESWRLRPRKSADKTPASMFVRGPTSSSTLRRPLAGERLGKPLVAAKFQLAQEARNVPISATTPVVAPMETNSNLQTVVEDLRLQVEKLSSLVAAGKTAIDEDDQA